MPVPQLPPEIWALIAKYLKREPPPVGERGNWNDHFHQQDLANLMRVNEVSSSFKSCSQVLLSFCFPSHSGLFFPSSFPPPSLLLDPPAMLHTRSARLLQEPFTSQHKEWDASRIVRWPRDRIDVQDIYRVTSAILYDTPIVQNMGLFLRGIERPYPRLSRDDNRRRAGYEHKRHLLGRVKKLHIVHASSNRSRGEVFMTVDGGARKIDTLLTAYDADILGLMDLSGWQLARDFIAGGNTLTKKFDPDYQYKNYFIHLETVSFGAFDDGRWARYDSQEDELGLNRRCGSSSSRSARYGSLIGTSSLESFASRLSLIGSSTIGTSTDGAPRIDVSRIGNPRVRASIMDTYNAGSSNTGMYRLGSPLVDSSTLGTFSTGFSASTFSAMIQTRGKDVCPSFAIKTTIRDLFMDSKSLVICSNARSAVKLEQRAGLSIIHQKRLESMHTYPLGPTRIYTTTKHLDNTDLLVLSLCFDRQKKPFFQSRTPIRNSDSATDSAPSWASFFGSGRRESALQKVNLEICLVPYKEGHVQLASDIKDALDKFHKAAKKVDGTDGHWGVLKILVGDDVPPCPCCGRRN
jgi:hypothetical protein